jgi:YegS/Rv2252/BmrU family lipid kinase
VTLALIVNPRAAGGRTLRTLDGVQAALTAYGLDHHVEQTRDLDHARELGRAAHDAGETAVAFGGDGLIAAVADALRGTDGVVGVLPGGRGNDFARVLGIPLEPRKACQVLATGVVRSLDMGQAGEATFVGIASCGFDSDANRIANESRHVHGSIVYAYAAVRALVGWRPATFAITLDGEDQRTVTGYSVAAANSKAYGGGMYLAPDASLDDGLLDVLTIGHLSKPRFLRLLPSVFKGRHVRQREVTAVKAREVEISADRPFILYADGDPIAELPVTVRALPAAVRVIVPR